MKIAKVTICCALFVLPLLAVSAPPEGTLASPKTTATLSVDNTTFIDANQILMFVTNHANYGRDLDAVFGHWYGTWWPYAGDTSLIGSNIDSAADRSPLWAAGLWLGGIDSVSGNTLVAFSEYSDEYVPGPMAGGTFMPDNPAFKVYKLYMDSLGSNPNADYLNWPTDQGAPLDAWDNPYMLGRQMLWTVFNDADPSAHTNDGGNTAPMGIEVQQTVWAGDELGDDTVYYNQVYQVAQIGESPIEVTAWIVDREALTGDDYRVVFEDTILTDTIEDPEEGTIIDTLYIYAWHLENVTDDVRVLEWQYPDSISEAADGLKLLVTSVPPAFESFEVVANGGGVVDPSQPGAMASAGFPTPGDADPGNDQQVGAGKWLFHTGDNGGTSGGGTRCCYEDFLTRIFRGDPARIAQAGNNDFEMRFTGSPGNPGVEGSWAWEWATNLSSYWVPFELWRIGVGTPDDPSDDVRLLPYIWGDGDTEYNMASYGSDLLGNCGPHGCEHSVDDGDDDPYMNWIYWRLPSDSSAGEAGYLAYEAEMMSNPTSRTDDATAIIDRTVLVNWDGGIQPPFNQDCPEQGTIFRIRTVKLFTPPDTFTFTADDPPFYVTSLEGSSLYIKYKLYNKGTNVLKNVYAGFWADPDLGTAGDDLVGCDTLNDIWFCYNGDDDDGQYGTPPPALGFKVLYGPLVPSVDDTAYFDGNLVLDSSNLGMTAFSKYVGGADPDNFNQTYGFLQGLTKDLTPYSYLGQELTYQKSGDPVLGVGDLDIAPDDRRMSAASGPFDLRPGDSQFVLIKMAVGSGTDNLNSITEVKSILNEPFDPLTGVSGDTPPALPSGFAVGQNYPNPFNPSTTILYSLPKRAEVTIDIYNILGQRVRRLVDKTMPAGEHSVVWDGTNNAAGRVSTGLYFYRVKAGDLIDSKKMLLLK